MKYSTFKYLALLMILVSNYSHAVTPEVCEALKKEKYIPFSGAKHPSVMYLTDKSGNVMKGPIDFGTLEYRYNKKKPTILIPTKFRIIVFPKQIIPRQGDDIRIEGDSTILEKTENLCKNSTTYAVTYQTEEFRDEKEARKFLKKTPYQEEGWFDISFIDKKIEENGGGDSTVTPICRFDCRFVGTIVDGSKK
jgi:hypothetical protein